MPPIFRGILGKETLRCQDGHAGGLRGCVLRNNCRGAEEAGLNGEDKVRYGSNCILAKHSKSSQAWKSSRGVLIEARI